MTQTPSPRKRVQNLRSFTVQILHCKTKSIVGTGFVVSEEGLIVTCAHVVVAAGVNPRLGKRIPSCWELLRQSFFDSANVLTEDMTVEINVYFPQAHDPRQRTQTAIVGCCFHDSDDDVVLLKLKSALLPEGVQVAIVETASDSVCYSTEHRFKSFGYRRLSSYQGLPADGIIIDFCDPPNDRVLKFNPLVLKSQQIDSGMSGAAVLDLVRDKVVGIIAETSDITSGADRDTSFAVDCEVVLRLFSDSESLLEPLLLESKSDGFGKLNRETELAGEDSLSQVKLTAIPPENSSLSHTYLTYAPITLREWVGRKAFLIQLSQDWLDPNCLITGLIGFGGEGKSSLARRWIDDLFQSNLSQPDGVFWWGFYEHRNLDEFFEQLLKYLVPEIRTNQFPSNNAKVSVINAALSSRKCILVLDGLEILQHQNGDEFGLLTSFDLKTWLRSFAEGSHQSFCLITSRAPLLDLIDFTTYNHREVEHLSDEEGVELLQNLGLQAADEATLLSLVQQWNGYALVLNLIGSYVTNHCKGNLHCLNTDQFCAIAEEEPKYAKVSRVLRRYDDHLKLEERLFLNVFSAFRLPVPKEALKLIFSLINTSGALQALEKAEIINALVSYRILKYNPQAEEYTAHPLVRDYYLQELKRNTEWLQEVHRKVVDFYLSSVKETPKNPTINDLRFLIEAVHHYCQAGDYEEAYSILWERIYQRQRWVLTRQLGAYEVASAIVSEFFPNGNIAEQPLLKNSKNIIAMLGEAGHLQKNLGNLQHALSLYSRCIDSCLKNVEIFGAASNYIDLSGIHSSLGNLDDSLRTIHQAVVLATHIRNKKHRRLDRLNIDLNAKLGWFSFLSGDLSTAGRCFQIAEKLERKVTRTRLQQKRFLYGTNGIYHAKFLQKLNKVKEAWKITWENLDICEKNYWQSETGWCHCVLGDLFASNGEVELAQEHYDKAILIARSINHKIGLITALSTRGTWLARQGDSQAALSDLREALDYAVMSNYRLCEIDIRIGLSWANISLGNETEAIKEVERARKLSETTGYFWGSKGVEEVLAKIEDEQLSIQKSIDSNSQSIEAQNSD